MPKRKASESDTSGVIQGVDATIGTGKMVVDSLATKGTAEDAASRKRLAEAGYLIPPDAPMQIIHCVRTATPCCVFSRPSFSERMLVAGCDCRQDKGRGILANGFTQVFADVDGQKCRILDYAPTQSLQPVRHLVPF